MANSETKRAVSCSCERLVKYTLLLLVLMLAAGNLFSEGSRDKDSYELRITKNGKLLHVFSLKSLNEIEQAHFYYFHTNPIVYLFLVPGCLVFLALFMKRKNIVQTLVIFSFILLAGTTPDFPRESIDAGIKTFKMGDYKSALDYFNQALEKEKQNPALYYNRALCYYMLNQKGLALYSLRQSLKTGPQDHSVQKVLSAIESELGLKFQVAPVQVIHPNFTFIIIILLFNLALLALGLVFRYHKGTLFIIFVFFAFAFSSAVVIFIDSLVKINEQTSVVIVQEGVLKKIPLEKAQCWLRLKEGTSVKINGFAQDYALVKTGLGFEGWIKKAQLVTD